MLAHLQLERIWEQVSEWRLPVLDLHIGLDIALSSRGARHWAKPQEAAAFSTNKSGLPLGMCVWVACTSKGFEDG